MLIKLSSLIATHCHHSAEVTSSWRERPLLPALHPTRGDVVSTPLYPPGSTGGFLELAENPPAASEFMVFLFLFQLQMPICLQPFPTLCLSSLRLFPSEPAPILRVWKFTSSLAGIGFALRLGATVENRSRESKSPEKEQTDPMPAELWKAFSSPIRKQSLPCHSK